jgi:uncharacterized membrane protein YbaN (DUF454 family)
MKELTPKQKQFHKAMDKYNSQNYYPNMYKLVSILNVSMQVILLFILFSSNMPWYFYIIGIFIAYFLTDFINGLVHMYMDNNDDYNSIWGPFIASFHLHHKIEKYRDANIFLIYFNESGAKFWLVPYLAIVILLSTLQINTFLLHLLTYIGILSSFAEVSHYLCHNANSNLVKTLQKYRILLPTKHHAKHHQFDNQSYAFLNGSSDFIIDKIANKLYRGYKDGSDEHFKKYDGDGTKNRG